MEIRGFDGRAEPIQRFRYLLLPDDRTLSGWLRGSDGMLLSCVTIVGQRESYLSPLSETDMSIFELTHTRPVRSTSTRSGIRATRCLNLINLLMRSRCDRRVCELALKARLTSNTIMAVIGHVLGFCEVEN